MKSKKAHFAFVHMFSISLACIVVDMETGAVLTLGPLDTDPDTRHYGSLYPAVSGSCDSDGDPILGIPALGGEVAGQAIQHGLRLYAQDVVD